MGVPDNLLIDRVRHVMSWHLMELFVWNLFHWKFIASSVHFYFHNELLKLVFLDIHPKPYAVLFVGIIFITYLFSPSSFCAVKINTSKKPWNRMYLFQLRRKFSYLMTVGEGYW